MKMKNSKTSIANLNPEFTKSLKKFDLLHRQLMGNEAIVTSVDTGRHWGSIKKENRPLNWELMTEAQVRDWSDSKHYTEPCDALDFRRRNPNTDSDLNYYDDLTESQQQYFVAEIYDCFPEELFDIVFSRLCIHCEYDPDRKTFPILEPRKLTGEDLEMKQPIVNTMIPVDEIKPITLEKPKFKFSFVDLVDWKNMPKALMNGVFRHFTKFNLLTIKTASIGDNLT